MSDLKQPEYFSFLLQEPCLDCVAFLAQATGLSKSAVKAAMAKGALWYADQHKPKRLRRKSVQLAAGTELHFYFDSQLLDQVPRCPTLVEDCVSFSVWDKPAGMSMQGSKWCDHTAFERWVSVNYLAGGQVYLVHRLDRWTSGLVMVAHSKKVAARLAALFADRQIRKQYLALTKADIDLAACRTDLPMTLDAPVEGKLSKTQITAIKPATTLLNKGVEQNIDAYDFSGVFELSVTLETGRKHQIRRHCAGIGWPLIGDRLYGEELADNTTGIDLQLRSVCLGFSYEGKDYLWQFADCGS